MDAKWFRYVILFCLLSFFLVVPSCNSLFYSVGYPLSFITFSNSLSVQSQSFNPIMLIIDLSVIATIFWYMTKSVLFEKQRKNAVFLCIFMVWYLIGSLFLFASEVWNLDNSNWSSVFLNLICLPNLVIIYVGMPIVGLLEDNALKLIESLLGTTADDHAVFFLGRVIYTLLAVFVFYIPDMWNKLRSLFRARPSGSGEGAPQNKT
jgi:hypothetical protein